MLSSCSTMKGSNMGSSKDVSSQTAELDRVSTRDVRSEGPSIITEITVVSDKGVEYRFEIKKNFLGENAPAFVLKEINPVRDADVINEMQFTKFWVLGGELAVGGTFALKQAANSQYVLKERIIVTRIIGSLQELAPQTAPA